MTTLSEALQRKLDDLLSDEISPGCIIKPFSRSGCMPTICTSIIAMDHQEITSIGDTKELVHIFENLQELDISTNQLRYWSDVFAILECSPRLRFLNLSYNPLHDSSLFFETNFCDFGPQSESPDNSTPSPSDFNLNFDSSGDSSTNMEINLLSEISVSEEDRNEQSSIDILKAPNSAVSCLSFQLNTLLLNSTKVPWKRVLHLLNYLPSLTTLHTALNDYSACCRDANESDSLETTTTTTTSKSPVQFPQLTHLYFSDNRLATWADVCCLGSHFPNLEHLVLFKNPLKSIPPMTSETSETSGGVQPSTPFAKLEDLNLMETQIGDWGSVDAIGQWFPTLKSLRLGTEVPLLETCVDAKELRYDVIARVPTLTSYNVTLISEEERERAERDFVRRFGQLEEPLRPQRYWELRKLHGDVAPFVSVNLTPKKTVRMRIQYGDQEKWHTCNLRASVGRLRVETAALFGVSAEEARRCLRLQFLDVALLAAGAGGPEEMRHLPRLLYTFHPRDGDYLILVPK